MYKIVEKKTGYVIDVAWVSIEARKELEEVGFISIPVK